MNKKSGYEDVRLTLWSEWIFLEWRTLLPSDGPHGLAQVDGHLILLVLDGFVGSRLDEEVDDLHVAAHGCPVQRRVVPDVQRVELGAVFNPRRGSQSTVKHSPPTCDNMRTHVQTKASKKVICFRFLTSQAA